MELSQPQPDEQDAPAAVSCDRQRRVLDVCTAERFVAALDPERRDWIFQAFTDAKAKLAEQVKAFDLSFATGKGTKKAADPLARQMIGALPKLVAVIENAQQQGAAIAVTVNRMAGRARARGAVSRIVAIWADIDGELPDTWPVPYSAIVETSPGCFHVYWFIDGDMSVTDFDGIMRRLVKDFCHDAGCCDPSRVMRLPGSWHLKDARPPHQVRLVGCDAARRYSPAEMIAAFPPIKLAQRPAGPVDPSRFPPDLKRMQTAIIFISPDERHDWRDVGFSLHNDFAGSAEALAVWELWSKDSPKFVPGECATMWAKMLPGRGITGATIIKRARDNGWTESRATSPPEAEPGAIIWPETKDGRPVARSQDNILAHLAYCKIELRDNVFANHIEFRDAGGGWRQVRDRDMRKLWANADSRGLKAGREYFGEIISAVAERCPHHPVLAYLDALIWDGAQRVDRWLTTYLGAEDTPLNRAIGRKTLAAAVRRVRNPGCKFDSALVLERRRNSASRWPSERSQATTGSPTTFQSALDQRR